MSDSPLQIESDDEGTRITLDLGALNDMRFTDPNDTFPGTPRYVSGKLDTMQALALVTHVRETLGEWAREAFAASADVEAGRYAPDDPKHPDYADRMAGHVDALRKAQREGA